MAKPKTEAVVYANEACVLAHNGDRIRVRPGEPWAASDPLVKRYPHTFVKDLPAVRCTTDPRGWRECNATPEPAPEPTTPEPAEEAAVDTTPEPTEQTDVDPVEVEELPVERATAAPGERRTGRRAPGRRPAGD